MKKISSKAVLALTLSSTLLLSSIPGLSVFAAAKPATQSFTGFLIDSYCGTKGYDPFHKIDIKKSPEKHLTECLSMDDCMKSGVGISIKQSDGTYKYFKFDKKGSKMADDNIMMMTKKKFNVKIAATGTLNGNVITVASVKEVK